MTEALWIFREGKQHCASVDLRAPDGSRLNARIMTQAKDPAEVDRKIAKRYRGYRLISFQWLY